MKVRCKVSKRNARKLTLITKDKDYELYKNDTNKSFYYIIDDTGNKNIFVRSCFYTKKELRNLKLKQINES
jgi:hypothetical protein